ncbi:MAG: response regulator [Taibaiella sp.]|nr:response regulator [Taibaiella sp.]
MNQSKVLPHEEERIAVLKQYNIIGSLPDEECDSLARLAATLCGTPVAGISFIDQEKQWFKACIGLRCSSLPLDHSVCRHTLLQNDIFEIKDLLADTRFCQCPLVTVTEGLRYYAGFPIINKDGIALGTLFVMSKVPAYSLGDGQLDGLRTLAATALALTEAYRDKLRAAGLAERAVEAATAREEALADKLSQLESITKTGTFDVDAATGKTVWSDGMYHLLEYKNDDYVPDYSLLKFISRSYYPEVSKKYNHLLTDEVSAAEAYKKVKKKGGKVTLVQNESIDDADSGNVLSEAFNFDIVTLEGRTKSVKAVFTRRIDHKGKFSGLQGMLQENTAGRAMAQNTPLAEINIYTDMPFGYLQIGHEGDITVINNTLSRWLGYEEEGIGTQTLTELLYDDGNIAIADMAALSKEKAGIIDLQFRCADKSRLYCQAAISPSPAGIHLWLTDISPLKKAYGSLAESEAMYRAMVEESALMMFTADVHGRFTYVSNRLKKTIGYNDKDLLGKQFASIYDGEWRKKAIAFYQKQLLDKTEETTFLFPIIVKTGEKLWIEQVATLIKKNTSVVGYRFALYDITERLKTQEAMQEAARLATQAKEMQQTFLGKMSHEIRTPMNGVVGMVNLLNTTILTDEQKEFVDGIKESSVNMIRIINDILDVTKIESGKLVFEETEFVLKNLVNSVIFTLKAVADEKNIKLISQIDSRIPDSLVADPVRLNQILLNLADNALKFTDKGSVSITVSLKELAEDHIELEFVITDTGIGIPQNKINSVFESFTQAQSDTTRKYGGTGLGLTIAKQLIEQQKGEISVASKEGVGTTFTFTFNFKPNKASLTDARGKLENMKIISLAGYNILLVEDNIMNQRVAKYTIEKWGAKVVIADSGHKALDLVAKENFDLILMDIQMPEMNGIQTTSRLRKEMKCKMPIMAMTASVMLGERENCMKAGMNDYISKPFNPAELNKKMYDLMPKKAPDHVVKITNINYLKNVVGGEPEAVKEILELYLSKTPPLLEAIESDQAAGLLKLVQSHVHNLKNSVGIIGADSLFHLLDNIEFNLNKLPPAAPTLEMLEKMKQLTRQSLKEIVEEYKLL